MCKIKQPKNIIYTSFFLNKSIPKTKIVILHYLLDLVLIERIGTGRISFNNKC